MNINFKPINEIPEIEALEEGDKVLVNHQGMARLLDGSKVGGNGSGRGLIYVYATGSGSSQQTVGTAYADLECTIPMTFEETVEKLMSGCFIYALPLPEGYPPSYYTPAGFIPQEDAGTIIVMMMMGQLMLDFNNTAAVEE